jgi:polysaccharide export outer membrane protein
MCGRQGVVAIVSAIVVLLAGCTAMAPGIQFSNAEPVSGNDAPQTHPPIQQITPALVKAEREARDRRAADDIGALMQPAEPYRIAAGDVLAIVVWDHPELSATMLPQPAAAGAGAIGSPPVRCNRARASRSTSKACSTFRMPAA